LTPTYLTPVNTLNKTNYVHGLLKAAQSRKLWKILAGFEVLTSRGRCYDHNFLRFLTFSAKKLAFFSKTNVIACDATTGVNVTYDHNFLRNSPIFGQKIAFFLKAYVLVQFSQNSSVLNKTAICVAKLFCEMFFYIIGPRIFLMSVNFEKYF
jgi:hypothetical protein